VPLKLGLVCAVAIEAQRQIMVAIINAALVLGRSSPFPCLNCLIAHSKSDFCSGRSPSGEQTVRSFNCKAMNAFLI
jgi:hypothetical protein